MTYKHDYAAFEAEVLCADFMVDEMRRRALLVADRAVELSPYASDDPDGDHYIDHFSVQSGVRGKRAYGQVTNDHEAAVDIEYGTGGEFGPRPQGGSSPRHRVLGRALDAAAD